MSFGSSIVYSVDSICMYGCMHADDLSCFPRISRVHKNTQTQQCTDVYILTFLNSRSVAASFFHVDIIS